MSRFAGNRGIKNLTDNSYKAIDEGIYDVSKYDLSHTTIEVKRAIYSCPHAPLITEIKFASPSVGNIHGPLEVTPESVAAIMLTWGAIALSVLTQPYLFKGSPDYLARIRKMAHVPILMKDIVVSEVQVDAAKRCGADCILFIKSVFDQDLAESSIEKFIEYARRKSLQVLLEVHTENEFKDISKYGAEIIGINNRDLENLRVDIRTTAQLLKEYGKGRNIIISESGIKNPDDIRFLKRAGADAFLVGRSIMEAQDMASKIRELYYSI